MIFFLSFACVVFDPDLVGDSDRPLDPSIQELKEPEGGTAPSELSAYANDDSVYVTHSNVHLPCDLDESEITIDINTEDFFIEIVYSERSPEDCYHDLEYSFDFTDAPSGRYLLEAHGDETSFDF